MGSFSDATSVLPTLGALHSGSQVQQAVMTRQTVREPSLHDILHNHYRPYSHRTQLQWFVPPYFILVLKYCERSVRRERRRGCRGEWSVAPGKSLESRGRCHAKESQVPLPRWGPVMLWERDDITGPFSWQRSRKRWERRWVCRFCYLMVG